MGCHHESIMQYAL